MSIRGRLTIVKWNEATIAGILTARKKPEN